MQIIPSVLVQSEAEFRRQVGSVRGVLNFLQLDIADGKFVPNTTWADPQVVAEYSDINFELHLMVQNPLAEIKKWGKTPNIKKIIFHIETLPANPQITDFNLSSWEIGLALNPDTPINTIQPYLSQITSVLFMAVYPGFQGQKLIPGVLKKIKKFKNEHPDILAEIDGAVNEETLPEIIKSKADVICPGSAIFKNEHQPRENVKKMQKIIHNLTLKPN